MDLAGSAVGSCCSCVFPPLGRQLGYVAKVGERVEDLVRAMRELKARSKDVTARIEEDQRIDPTRLPTDEVEEWLRNVHEVEDEVNSIKASYEQIRCRCLGGCSANICSNWKIGRKATYVLLRVNDLSQRVEDFVINVTRAGPPPPGQLLPGTDKLLAMEFNLKKVMYYLHAAADNALTIGIFGMGGVGKTTLLKAINNQLCSGGGGDGKVVFQHVIWVVVSSNASVEKLQKDIADTLKLQLRENATSMMRHDAIFNFLNNKKFILLLDDVWERLDLDGVGIPDRRFVLFTTRSEDVCGQMGASKTIKVECLQNEEAWRLFVDKVGVEIICSSPEIKKLAKEVAEECKGLPLALNVLGRAMASKRTTSEWRNTLASLKKSQQGNIQKQVFDILKHSYDSLRDEATRRCFLFCALYKENYFFGIDELIQCFWRHGLVDVDGCSNYGLIYDLVYEKVVGVLMSACLLAADDDTTVKMHGVIRDMALWIARDCGGNDTKWIVRAGLKSEQPLKGVDNWEVAEILSLQGNDIRCLPMPERSCEKLSTLMLQGNYNLEEIPKSYFECLPALTYLDLSYTKIEGLPGEVSSLIQLQYLNLSYTPIESLSINVSDLEQLKHLILRECHNLKYIPYGLISCLSLLQSLDMNGCYSFDFSSSEYFIEDRAHLKELKTLKQLKFVALVKKMGRIADLVNVVDVVTELELDALQDSNSKDFIMNLMKIANGIEYLRLRNFSGHVLKYFQRLSMLEMFPRLTRVEISGCWDLQSLTWTGHLPCLRSLIVANCKGLKKIISASRPSSSIFPNLCSLSLVDLENLHSIYNAILDTPKLSRLIVIGCPKLKRLPFSFQQQITEKREIRLQFEEEWWGELEWDDTSIKSYLDEQREISLISTRFNFI